MKAFLLVFAFGISLKVAQSKINVDLNLDLLFAQSADTEKRSYKPCCHAKTLEGSISILQQNGSYSPMKFYFDHKNRRYAAEDLLSTIKIIVLCDSNSTCLVYSIIENQKICSKGKVSNITVDDFVIRCIPNNATSLGAVRIGSGEKQSSLLLQNWKFMHLGLWHQRLVTDVDCIPVADFVSRSPDSPIIWQVYYFGISKRIKDPRVFTPPSYCDKANEMREDSKFQERMFNSLFSTFK